MAEMWNFEEKNELEGLFVRREDNVGPNNSKVYYVNVNGEEVCFWGNTVLDNQLAGVIEGKRVKVNYLGKAVSPKTKREYKNFEVYLWEEPLPF